MRDRNGCKIIIREENGVPALVQYVEFDYDSFIFKAYLFNGQNVSFSAGIADIGIETKEPTPVEYARAMVAITRVIESRQLAGAAVPDLTL